MPIRSQVGGLSDSPAYREIGEIGLRVGGYATLGLIIGLVLASLTKAIAPRREVSYGEWTAYSAALFGLFAALVEVFALIGVG